MINKWIDWQKVGYSTDIKVLYNTDMRFIHQADMKVTYQADMSMRINAIHGSYYKIKNSAYYTIQTVTKGLGQSQKLNEKVSCIKSHTLHLTYHTP